MADRPDPGRPDDRTTNMIAIEISQFGGPEVLRPVERPSPEPGVNEVLIEVHAAGVNRPDLMQRQGKYPPPPGAPDIPGLEISGTIIAVARFLALTRRGACFASAMDSR